MKQEWICAELKGVAESFVALSARADVIMDIADVDIFTCMSDQGIQNIGIQSGLSHFVVYRKMVDACRFHEDTGRQIKLLHDRIDTVNGTVQ